LQNKQSLTVNYFLRLLVPIIVLCVGGAIALFLLPSALTANAEKNLLAVLLLVIGAVTPLWWLAKARVNQNQLEIAVRQSAQQFEEKIAQHQQTEKECRQLTLESNRAKQAKDEFLAAMSHELRTPLSAIIGNNEILAEGELTADQRQLLHASTLSSKQLLLLINDVLDLSAIETDKLKIDYAPFDLMAMIGDVTTLSVAQAEISGIQFENRRLLDPKFKVWGDVKRISQVLTNLLDNAVKFTDQGRIVFACWVDGEQLCFSVEDTGVGMSPEIQERLFEPFEQADSSISRRCGGMGLGLHLSGALVEMMDGTIEVFSEAGKGSNFVLKLPYSESELLLDDGDHNSSESSSIDRFVGDVLIVEDTPELQLLERRILEGFGVAVTIANNGKEAVDEALSKSYDLILMDMQMPVMDGLDATEKLRSVGCYTPIAALTANVTQQHREQFLNAGANNFLQKPIDRVELQKTLKLYLKLDSEPVKVESLASSDASVDVEHPADGETKPYPVLAIDDEPSILELYQTIFGGREAYSEIQDLLSDLVGEEEPDGQEEALADEFTLSLAGQGQTAVDMARVALEEGRRFPIAFIDMRMPPGMNGLETAKALRALDKCIFIVIVTAYSDVDQKQIREELGYGMLYLSKPFHTREIVSIARILTQVCGGRAKAIMEAKTAAESSSQSTAETEADPFIDDELMSIFIDGCRQRLESVTTALTHEDWDALRTAAHNVKGSAVTFGYPELSEMATEVQLAIDEGQFDQVPSLTMELIAELEKMSV